MARQINITRWETVERAWECPHCLAHGVVTLRARGESGWRREGWFDSGEAERGARQDAAWSVMDDAERMLGMITCPKCRQYAPRARFWSVARAVPRVIFGALVAGGVSVALFSVSPLPALLGLLVTPVGVYVGLMEERRRWKEARGAVVIGLQPGERPKELPKAIARQAPRPAPAPAPLAPLRTTAPEAVERADDASGPRFLKDG